MSCMTLPPDQILHNNLNAKHHEVAKLSSTASQLSTLEESIFAHSPLSTNYLYRLVPIVFAIMGMWFGHGVSLSLSNTLNTTIKIINVTK